jgi:hypothetical protein
MIKLTSLLKELDFGFGLGTTEPDYEDVPVEMDIYTTRPWSKQTRLGPVQRLKGDAHLHKMSGTDLPIITVQLPNNKSIKLSYIPEKDAYFLMGSEELKAVPISKETIEMFDKLKKKRIKTNL